jgi:DNA-binding NarL/FixJ family response regulator
MKKTRILLVDDHQLFREGLANILNSQDDFEVVGEANDGIEALIKARKLLPEMILMDITMPGSGGLGATQAIKREMPEVTIVILTVSDEEEKLFEAIRNGAQGYLLKSIRSKEMLEMIRGAVRGEAAITPSLGGRMLIEFRRMSQQMREDIHQEPIALTAREQEILKLVANGATNIEIAEKLSISIHTVKSHMRKILSKLHRGRRHQAVSKAIRDGLITPSMDESA